MDKKEYLYRGCSTEFMEKNNGILKPKQDSPFASFMCAGQEYAQAGRGLVAGCSVANEIVRHEYKQKGIPTSGISTTPHIKRAIFYATNGGKYNSGYIYKIDRSLLSKYCVSEFVVANYVPCPSIPEDDEVILVALDFGQLPAEIIVSVEFFEENNFFQNGK